MTFTLACRRSQRVAERAEGTWIERWRALRRDVVELVVPQLTPSAAVLALTDADAAVAAAAGAPGILTHGDLGSVRVDPTTGALARCSTGTPPARAIRLWIWPPSRSQILNPVLERLLIAGRELRGDLWRARAYARTVAVQDAVFGLQRGDACVARAGLAPYRE